ncbi:P-loop containing nucleoside triphosphate hydrolase protein [Mycena rebaudengoi]|nr:P-loop containing nucleoside triphosphate hydrolase protein [Mycena rebaudengoi]
MFELPLNWGIWDDSLAIPVFCTALSASIFCLHATLSRLAWRSANDTRSTRRGHRFAFELTRVCGCVTLLLLSFIPDEQRGAVGAFEFHPRTITIQTLLCFVYFYASGLALMSLCVPRWSPVATKHLNILLVVVLSTYLYRDLFPLATFGKRPQDLHEGWRLWTKLAVLCTIGIFMPLLAPRSYVPFDIKEAMPTPSPEQTASICSLVLYNFLDPLILLATMMPHLSYELLPPLADYNDAKNLKSEAFPRLDVFSGSRRRHIFFNLMLVFRFEYAEMVVLSIVQVATNFSSPVAIYQLLHYVETKGDGAIIRPWLWIVALFVGPTIGSIATQWCKFIFAIIQTQAILTELIFEHSLRVRVKAETSELGDAWQSSTTSQSTGKPASPRPTQARNLVGRINNLATTDLQNIVDSGQGLPQLLVYALQTCLGVWFLYEVLGWAAFVGLGVTVALFPLPGYIAGRIRFVQQGLMQRTDARVQTVSETLSLLRMIKLFAWERKSAQRIAEAREDELNWMWKSKALQLSIATTVIMKQELNASKVFSSMTVFDIFRTQLHEFFATSTSLVIGRVSLDRLNDFLHETELLDVFDAQGTDTEIRPIPVSPVRDDIGFSNATFSWSNDSDGSRTPNQRQFLLQIPEPLLFKRGGFNLIVGPTGSGKSSLLLALLGEMHFIAPSPDSWFNLPRDDGVAYAAQQSWVQNATIKDNIVFGAPFDLERYNKVIHQCGLERDLTMFEAGDLQEIGEGGVTLSGGQRARVTLARALYSRAAILLLDDVLAALDVHTAQWIVDKCFGGDLLVGRTTLLVTHNVGLAQSIASFVVSMGPDGRVLSQGSLSDALAMNKELAREVTEETKDLAAQQEVVERPQASGQLVVAEEIDIGRVSWGATRLYLSALGGRHPVFYFTVLVVCMVCTDALINAQTAYLGYFSSQYEDHPASQVPVGYHLSVYGAILFSTLLIYSCSYVFYLLGMVRASTIIHQELIESILGTTLRWLDVTPTSRVISLCTQDLRDIDANIGQSLWAVFDLVFFASIRLIAIIVLAPFFILPATFLLLVGMVIGRLYTKAQLSVKREMSNARAPVLAHFGAAIEGLVSIRAYAAQEAFILESINRINHYTRTARTFHHLSSWVAIRMDALGNLFITILAAYLVYFRTQDSAAIGFSLNMASGFGMIIMFGVSLERIKRYLEIEQEPKSTQDGKPPAHWPSSGSLRAESLSARYSPDGPEVLSNISFNITSGERIGIVGRTGSGKSSLTLALLRAILTEGTVYYDGLPISSLNLEVLRSNITIIPQVPELLNGTLRVNLDPLEEHDDATLNGALHAAGLFALQGGDGTQITLETMLASGGANLSVGQRQILALARALVRGSKVLVLDEDYETDEVIQKSLRTELGNDVTLLTVAHRLQSIMDADRIMVLEAGKIVEFASPRQLLSDKTGKLRALVDESQDSALLYQMAFEQR